MNRVGRDALVQSLPLGLTTVGIDVEVREIAAGNVQAHAVPAFEQVAGGKRLDHDFYPLPRSQ
ncbi:hypothetical protein D9M71_790400 [compost metagenome]